MPVSIENKGLILVGDTTSHGGTVLSGSSGCLAEGLPVARVGDPVSCPLCKGVFPIVEGAASVFETGMNIARHGDKTACGATLIARGAAAGGGGRSDDALYAAAGPVHQYAGKRALENPGPMKYTREQLADMFRNADFKALQNEMMDALNDSYITDNAGNVTHIQEQGGWLIRNADGSISLQRIEGGTIVSRQDIENGTVDAYGIRFSPQIPENAVGTFHTHPGLLKNQAMGQSFDDVKLADKLQLPGAVLDGNMTTGKAGLSVYDNTSEGNT